MSLIRKSSNATELTKNIPMTTTKKTVQKKGRVLNEDLLSVPTGRGTFKVCDAGSGTSRLGAGGQVSPPPSQETFSVILGVEARDRVRVASDRQDGPTCCTCFLQYLHLESLFFVLCSLVIHCQNLFLPSVHINVSLSCHSCEIVSQMAWAYVSVADYVSSTMLYTSQLN